MQVEGQMTQGNLKSKVFSNLIKSNSMCVCQDVCLSVELIRISFKVKLLKVPRKSYNYIGGGYPQEKSPLGKINPSQTIFIFFQTIFLSFI